MSLREAKLRIKEQEREELRTLIERMEDIYNELNKSSTFSFASRRYLKNSTNFLEKIISIESFDEEYKERARKLLEIGKDLTEKSNNMEKSQKQEKLEKTDRYIEEYNLINKKRHNRELEWEEGSINTKVDNELLNDNIKFFIDAVKPVIEKTKEMYEIETEQGLEKREIKVESNIEESTSTDLIPVKNKSIIKMWIEKIINKFKSFGESLFNRNNKDDNIIDVEYRELENPTVYGNKRNSFINQLGVNGIEKKEDVEGKIYTSGEKNRDRD